MKNGKRKGLGYLLLSILVAIVMLVGTEQRGEVSTVQASNAEGIEIHYIDVGQGDATLVKSGDHAMLIDAGPEDCGTKLQQYLLKQGVDSLDYLILTHPDSDHIGGGDVIITKFDCGTVMMPDYRKDTESCRDMEEALKYRGYTALNPAAGSSYSMGEASFTILGPVQNAEDANNCSIALMLTYGSNRFLFTGDAEEEEEGDLLASGVSLDADVYQAGHHGSSSSSSERFMEAINPSYTVISCGEGNSYGHPHAEVLNRLRSMHTNVFRTDEQGSLIAYSDGNTIRWNASPSTTWQAGEPTGSAQDPEPQKAEESNTAASVQNQTTSELSDTQQYILNTNTHKFHRTGCSSVNQMSEKNKKFSTGSREDIIALGYEPCKRCNP